MGLLGMLGQLSASSIPKAQLSLERGFITCIILAIHQAFSTNFAFNFFMSSILLI